MRNILLHNLWLSQHLLFSQFSVGEKSRSDLAGSSGSEFLTGESVHHLAKDPHSSSLTRLAMIGLSSLWVVALKHPFFFFFLPCGPLHQESHIMSLCFMSTRDSKRESHSSLQHNHRSDIPLLFGVFCSLKRQETGSSPLSGEVNT